MYTFTGNGSWKVISNWLNNKLPPRVLPVGDSIIIDPAGSGTCVLDTIQIIPQGAFFKIRNGKKFSVMGNIVQAGGITEKGDSTFIDYRDSQIYPFRHIGNQVWMTKNFNYAAEGSWCYKNNEANCAIYGRLYDWNIAVSLAPPGWHLPSVAEWDSLNAFLSVDSFNLAGGAMKDTVLWNSPNVGATNRSGFAGLPGGLRTYYFDTGIGEVGYWWSSTGFNNYFARYYFLADIFNDLRTDKLFKDYGFSVRYVRDAVQEDSAFTDPRDGQKYPYKTIGTQVWMTKNLNYAVPGSSCYDDDTANCYVYGHLYNWNTALTVAPPGWHLPSDAEWTKLTDYLGGENVAGGAMKSTYLWNNPNTGATNSSGFSGLPGGYRDTTGSYYGIGPGGSWWSSTENNTSLAWKRGLSYTNPEVSRGKAGKGYGFSVRCVKD